MGGPEGVKPDPALWMPLVDDYRLTTLPHDTVFRGSLKPGLHSESPEVREAVEAWPARVFLHDDGERTEVVLVYQMDEKPTPWPLLHVILLAATLVTTLGAGALLADVDPFRTRVLEFGDVAFPYPSGLNFASLWVGAPFAFPFLGVLLTHEMGHYLAARRHGVRASLPYFIPFPPYFSIVGTMGAFIRLRGASIRRSVLFDIGAAGPLASFVVSVPLLAVGLHWSEAVPSGPVGLTTPFLIRFAGQSVWLGNGVAAHLLAELFGPTEVGSSLILLHPMALAGWLGLFVTALNLLPLGQLDGGHVLYALSPRRHVAAARMFLLALIPLGLLWWGWWGWAVLVLVIHRGRVQHPRVLQPEPGLGSVRTLLAWTLIVIFFLTLIPVPIEL